MKIYSNQADNFVKNVKPGNVPAVLIYGPDSGAVQEYKRKVSAAVLPGGDAMAIKEFTSDQIKDDPALLLDEVNAMSFFADQRVIIINDFAAGIVEVVNQALDNIPKDLTIIITASELGKESKFRKFFEDHKTFPTIICYKEDERNIRVGIMQKFGAQGVRVEPDAMNFLAANLGEDKGVTNNEIDKILLYLGSQKTLSFEEVTELLADSSELTTGDIAQAVISRDMKRLEKSLARAFAEQVNAVPILRAVAWQLQRVATVKMMIQNGMTADTALNSLRPAVFFRQVQQFKAGLAKWNAPQLKKALSEVTAAELAAKGSGIEPDMVCRNTLLKLAAN